MKLIVQIPAYNEATTMGNVIREIPHKILGIDKVEILVADDGSTDETAAEAKKAGANYILRNKYNRGLGRNFKSALDYALSKGADIIVNIDGDGQFNPKDIPKLIQPILNKEADMVTCSRFLNPQLTRDMPQIKKWGNRRFTKLVNKITGQRFTDTQCGFRAYSREAALRLNLQGKFTYTQEVFIDLAQKGIKIKEIPLEVVYNKERESHVSGNLRRYGFKSLAIIMRATRDSQPLTFFGLPGGIILFIGFLGGLVSFIYWLLEHVTTPIRTLFNVSVFFMIFGISLIILALLADMLLTLKRNQEEILYRLKKQELGGK
jgi:glycosyltransferase involved in cell wall biosynthesis